MRHCWQCCGPPLPLCSCRCCALLSCTILQLIAYHHLLHRSIQIVSAGLLNLSRILIAVYSTPLRVADPGKGCLLW